nr:hypothetical protein [uncultured Desulfuromonas sp.]
MASILSNGGVSAGCGTSFSDAASEEMLVLSCHVFHSDRACLVSGDEPVDLIFSSLLIVLHA